MVTFGIHGLLGCFALIDPSAVRFGPRSIIERFFGDGEWRIRFGDGEWRIRKVWNGFHGIQHRKHE